MAKDSAVQPRNYLWWQRGVVYQIYPLSFQDSNGDGKGDLEGIRRRLDYLAGLGIDAVWISPIYPSPMKDFGYDIADYCNVAPTFGTLNDFDALIGDVHRRGMKLILDLVPNHTSDQHPWFVESRSSRENPKRDWYIWRDAGDDGGLPNNWLSVFGGKAWEWDPATKQYYYHAFLKEQPDLNWRNRAVREAMYNVIRFWLDRGVDGFRIDVLWHLIKDDQFRDNPPNPGFRPGDAEHRSQLQLYNADRPEMSEVITEMRALFDEYTERVMIGEIYLPIERLVAYYGLERPGVHLPFNFQLIQAPWNACEIERLIVEYDRLVPADEWPNWVLGNHDQKRIASRVGPAQARVAAMLLLTLRGTPTMYYADEIGLENGVIPPERVQDPAEKNEPGLGLGRDPERTPMQWDPSPNAGFTQDSPWLPVSKDFHQRNVKVLADDATSVLSLYKRLLGLRRTRHALRTGAYIRVACEGNVMSYERRSNGEGLLIVLNFGHQTETAPIESRAGSILLSTQLDRVAEPVSRSLTLRPDEGVIVELSS